MVPASCGQTIIVGRISPHSRAWPPGRLSRRKKHHVAGKIFAGWPDPGTPRGKQPRLPSATGKAGVEENGDAAGPAFPEFFKHI